MPNVIIVRKGTEKTGTWCFHVKTEEGESLLVDNCHRTDNPLYDLNIECYYGTAHFNEPVSVFLQIYKDGHAVLEVKNN